jgi:23S rRNA (adenine2503-C2)-methyltransferase
MVVPLNILDLTPAQLKELLRFLGEKPSHSEGILKSVYRECRTDFEGVIGLSPALRLKLAENARVGTIEPLDERVSADGQTVKLLFRLEDGKTVESALMYSKNSSTGRERHTVCVSSQVGCSVGCNFCATGQQGFERNLRAGEIIEQALYFVRRYHCNKAETARGRAGNWLTNVVFMGMGEPLANYENVRQAIDMFNSWMGLGFHQVTLSTAGLVPQIRRLIGESIRFELAISLHAATNEVRDRLVPVNKKYPVELLISECKEYAARTGRRLFIEYALFDGVNDFMGDADDLLRVLDGLDCSINLILGNPTRSGKFQPSDIGNALEFQKRLIAGGTRTMMRVSRGTDIEAGCGQLRSRWLDSGPGLII